MKRFISALLVAVLLISSIATVAFAAGGITLRADDVTAEAGAVVEIPFAISGDNFAAFEGNVTVAEGLTIEKITINKEMEVKTASPKNGYVAGANTEELEATGVLFTVMVKVADDIAAGKYEVSFNAQPAYNAVYDELTVSVDSCIITIEGEVTEEPTEEPTDPPHVHAFGEWTVSKVGENCLVRGEEIRVCECGETETREGDYGPHIMKTEWDYNDKEHYHMCSVCKDYYEDQAPHDLNKWVTVKEATDEDPIKIQHECCTVCDYYIEHKYDMTPEDPDKPDPTGDISGAVNTGLAVLVISLCSVAAIVIKRKTAV